MNRKIVITLVLALSLLIGLVPAASAGPMSGAIWTTDSLCIETNVNQYASKMDVYLNGGPTGGGGGLPDGYYWVQVTTPGGALLGKSSGAVVQVVNGDFVACYQLWYLVYKASDGSQGYDDTTNPGWEYKVWVSQYEWFPSSDSKTDNFKVKLENRVAYLDIIKFYDANANGINDDGQLITGWKVLIQNGADYIVFTPYRAEVPAGSYCVTEFMPVQPNWMATTPKTQCVTVGVGQTAYIEFGNLCLGAGGGKTLGFWSNKNGEALFGADDLAQMVALNLRAADGSHFDPASYAAFRSWLLSATATNMAYMLSAQLAAMKLNVYNGFVYGGALIYAPGTMSANPLGFATVNAIMAEADAELGLHGTAYAGDAWRSYQEALKNALDKANNNMTFVQPTPCPFSF